MVSSLIAVAATLLGSAPADTLTATIDRHIAARWHAAGVSPAARCDDAEFCRRVHLDLVGVIPSAGDARAFLDDPSSGKRARWVEKLLASPAFARHRADVLTAQWIPQSNPSAAEDFRRWLEAELRRGTPYDRLVRRLLTSPSRPHAVGDRATEPRGFLAANDFKPENLAANSARLFLGLNLECAQCHNHPFARWSNEQFWELAAFFKESAPSDPADGLPQIMIAANGKTVQAKYPDGSAPAVATSATARTQLVDWMTSPENPYFRRNAVNRVWAELLGAGLVEPVDDLSGAVEPSHPELLDALADALAERQYDLRTIIRAIVLSEAYQLTSAGSSGGEPSPDPQLFAKGALRPLSGQQLYASILRATAVRSASDLDRQELLAQFPTAEARGEPEASVLQALLRMNGPLTSDALDDQAVGIVAATDAPWLDRSARVEALYLAVLSRRPTPEEQALVDNLVAAGCDERAVRRDLLWALLNSAEFSVNH